jgi:deoxyhypusine synthase
MDSYLRTGFQATAVGQAIEEINRMRAWRLSDVPIADDEKPEFRDPEVRRPRTDGLGC